MNFLLKNIIECNAEYLVVNLFDFCIRISFFGGVGSAELVMTIAMAKTLRQGTKIWQICLAKDLSVFVSKICLVS